MNKENVLLRLNGIFFSHKKNEIMLFAGKWVQMEILLTELIWVPLLQ